MEFGEHERGARVAQGAAEFSNILVKYFSCVRKKGIEAFGDGRTLDEIALWYTRHNSWESRMESCAYTIENGTVGYFSLKVRPQARRQ